MLRVLIILLIQHLLINVNASEEHVLSSTAEFTTIDNLAFIKLGSYSKLVLNLAFLLTSLTLKNYLTFKQLSTK